MNAARALFTGNTPETRDTRHLALSALVFRKFQPLLDAASTAAGCVSSPVTLLDQYPTVIAPPGTAAIRAR